MRLALLKEERAAEGLRGEGTFGFPLLFLKLHRKQRHRQSPEPSPLLGRHLESAGAEWIFVCCFITCSCFINADLKAAEPLYDFDGEGPNSASGDSAFRTDQRRDEISGSGPAKSKFSSAQA